MKILEKAHHKTEIPPKKPQKTILQRLPHQSFNLHMLMWQNKQTRGLHSAKQNQSHIEYSNKNQPNPDPLSEVELCQKYISWQGSVPTN